MVEFRRYNPSFDFDPVLNLYSSVNWVAYTNDPKKLHRALLNSHSVWVAELQTQIVGLIRTISDGEIICYIQDILVLPGFQNQGIGKKLIQKILETYSVRQFVLLTDNEASQKAFYESVGFRQIIGDLNSFVKFS